MQDSYNGLLRMCNELRSLDRDSIRNEKVFSKLLLVSLESLHMLQEELADLCKTSPASMSRWLAGTSVPTIIVRLEIVHLIELRARRLISERIKRKLKYGEV